MFDLDNPDNLAVFGGLAVGGAAALCVLFILAFTNPWRRPDHIPPGRIFSAAAAIASERPLALIGLWIGLTFVSAFLGLLSQITGLTLGIANLLLAAATIFLGHRTMLEPSAREADIELPRNGFWSTLLRSIVFGVIVIGVILAVFTIAALVNALAITTGTDAGFLVGLAGGVAAIALSTVFARMSFVYPSCVLGGRDWFATAIRRSAGAGASLATALWLMVILFVLLAIPAVMATGALLEAATPGPEALPLDPFEPDLSSPAVWAALIAEEFLLGLLVVAYSLASIACVSAAYRICVLERAGSGRDSRM